MQKSWLQNAWSPDLVGAGLVATIFPMGIFAVFDIGILFNGQLYRLGPQVIFYLALASAASIFWAIYNLYLEIRHP
jgi:hypothetical protein